MRKLQFANDQIYHVYNRGVDKRDIFLTPEDYQRFIHGLFYFNDEFSATNSTYYFQELRDGHPRKPLVEVLGFCLMPNHFHLLLRQVSKNGITRFMQKVGTGYTMYFNIKHERSGILFQGVFKAVHIQREAHFDYVLHYIHANPLDLYQRASSIADKEEFLKKYRWSSLSDYIGKSAFASITSRDLFLRYFEGANGYWKHLQKHLKRGESQLGGVKEALIDY